jgi:hypothetical protein
MYSKSFILINLMLVMVDNNKKTVRLIIRLQLVDTCQHVIREYCYFIFCRADVTPIIC